MYLYFAGPSSQAKGTGPWQHGPGCAYKMQIAQPDEMEIAKSHGWRESLVEAIAVYEGKESIPLPIIIDVDEAEPVDMTPVETPIRRGPGRPRKEM